MLSILPVLAPGWIQQSSGGVSNLGIQKIEVTQSVQYLDPAQGYNAPDNSLELAGPVWLSGVPFVAIVGKPVAVRVYLKHAGAPISQDPFAPVEKGVTVRLSWYATHMELPEPGHLPSQKEATFDVPFTQDLAQLRDDERGSANFILPYKDPTTGKSLLGKPDWTNLLAITAEVVFPDSNPADNIMSIQLGGTSAQGTKLPGGLFPHKPVVVFAQPVYYSPQPRNGQTYNGAHLQDMNSIPAVASKQMHAMYPMPVFYALIEGGYICYTGPDVRDGTGPLEDVIGTAKDAWSKSENYLDVLVGWLPDDAGLGCKGKGGPLKHGGWAYLSTAGCSDQGAPGDLLAHEVGHGLNVWHVDDDPDETKCWLVGDSSRPIAESGFNFLDNKAIPARTVDFMRSCCASSGNWISPYVYNRLLDKKPSSEWSKCATASSSAATMGLRQPLGSQPGQLEDALLLRGKIRPDGSGQLLPFYQIRKEGPLASSSELGSYAVDLYDQNNSLLVSYLFDPDRVQANGDTLVGGGRFSLVVPFSAAFYRADLRCGNVVLDTVVASASKPQVAGVTLNRAQDPTAVSWSATDADGSNLRFALFFSRDGGQTLFPFALDVEPAALPASFDMHSELFPGSDNCIIRVLASDGFNTGVADAAPFTISRKPPTVVIVAPASGAILHADRDLVLLGQGADPEDLVLPDAKLTWWSDINGLLGAGAEVVIPPGTLSLGRHTITLTGTDSDNQQSSAVISVQIAARTSTVLDPATAQYSDMVTLRATVSPETVPGQVQFILGGNPIGPPILVSNGVAAMEYQVLLPAGSYDLKAQFTSTDPLFQDSAGVGTLVVTREDALVAPKASNPQVVQVNTAGGTAGPVTLTADISELADGSAGDIADAVPVTFTLTPVTGGPPLTQTASVSGGGVGGTLAATCSFANVPVNVYDVMISIGGNYYTGSANTELAVYDPSLGFVTGGGVIVHNGCRANLDFIVKYLNSGQTQDSLLFVEHRPTGDIRLKGTAMRSLSIVNNTAIILGKATLNGVGNYDFRAMIVDNGEPGSSDQFGLQVTGPGGGVADLTFAPITLNGGNIRVPQPSRR